MPPIHDIIKKCLRNREQKEPHSLLPTSSLEPTAHPIPQEKPPQPLSASKLQIGVDAAFQERHDGTTKSAIGIHFCDWNLGLSLPIRATISSEAEAVGVWICLHLASRLGMTPSISCDNQSVAEGIAQQKLTMGRWRPEAPTRTPLFASRLIHEAREVRKKVNANIQWAEREENHIPHLLAAMGARNISAIVFLPNDVPIAEEQLLRHEYRSESVARIDDIPRVEIPKDGIVWQDWTTQTYLDVLARRLKSLRPAS